MAQPTRSVSCVALCLQCRHSWTKCRHLTSILRKKKKLNPWNMKQAMMMAMRRIPSDRFLLCYSPDLPRSIPIYPALTAFATISWFSSLHFLMRCFLSRHYVQWHLWEPTGLLGLHLAVSSSSQPPGSLSWDFFKARCSFSYLAGRVLMCVDHAKMTQSGSMIMKPHMA